MKSFDRKVNEQLVMGEEMNMALLEEVCVRDIGKYGLALDA